MFHEFMLGEVIKMLDGQAQLPGQELVRGVAINSRETRPGELFFALRGTQTDGHRYVADPVRGAVDVDRHVPDPISGQHAEDRRQCCS